MIGWVKIGNLYENQRSLSYESIVIENCFLVNNKYVLVKSVSVRYSRVVVFVPGSEVVVEVVEIVELGVLAVDSGVLSMTLRSTVC